MNRRPTPLDNEQCRSCSSFSDYIKSTKKNKQCEDGGVIKGGGASDGGHNVSCFFLNCCTIIHNKLCRKEEIKKAPKEEGPIVR